MNSLFYVIPDTSEPISSDEKEYLINLEKKGWHDTVTGDNDERDKLIKRGILTIFKYGDEQYVYDPKNCFIKSFSFRLRQFNLVKNLTSGQVSPKNADEERKQYKSRRLVSFWVCEQKEINDTLAAFYFYMFTFRINAIVSIPEFMTEKYKEDVEQADAISKEITPKIQRIRCNICGHISSTRLQLPEMICQDCGRTISK